MTNKLTINKYIVADPSICHGKPTFKGTRIMIWQVLEMLATGVDEKEVIKAFPSLKKASIKAALSYASSITREGYVVLNTTPEISA